MYEDFIFKKFQSIKVVTYRGKPIKKWSKMTSLEGNCRQSTLTIFYDMRFPVPPKRL